MHVHEAHVELIRRAHDLTVLGSCSSLLVTRAWPGIEWQAAGFLAMRRIAVVRAPVGIKMTGQTQKAHRANNAVFPLFNIFVRLRSSNNVMSALEQKEPLSA
jgi:hypothetical protein